MRLNFFCKKSFVKLCSVNMRTLFILLLLFLCTDLLLAQATQERNQIMIQNLEKLKVYGTINSDQEYKKSWYEAKSRWSESKKNLINWPVASESEQIELVATIYNYLEKNEKNIEYKYYNNKQSVKLNAATFAHLIERTQWSLIINREVYNVYPLLKYIELKH